MTDTFYALYRACFPQIIRSEETVRRVLSLPGNQMLLDKDGDKVIAASVTHENTVLMLCVLPAYRGRGIGSRLLAQTERQVRLAGYDSIQFCDGVDYITPGIPLYQGNQAFFSKRGYIHSWGDSECVDMSMPLADFHATTALPGDCIDGVTYRFAQPADRLDTLSCVQDACPEFVPYYEADDQYGASDRSRILIAVKDGQVCGALMVSNGTESPDVGSVGCTVTRTAHQGHGIATNMVKIGTHYLQTLGLTTGFLGYTYTAIVPMYAKSGYQVCMSYWMGKKKLCNK